MEVYFLDLERLFGKCMGEETTEATVFFAIRSDLYIDLANDDTQPGR